LNQNAIETIVNLVSERLQPRPVSSSWRFYEKAEPTSTNILDDSRPPENLYETKVIKSDLNDIFDIKKALSRVPREHRANATKLLAEIEKRSPQITYDSKGIIFIDGDSIPGSNIFTFLPILYKKSVRKTLPGFSDFLAKLNSLGLQKYFVLEKNYKSKLHLKSSLQNELDAVKSKQKSWWLLK